MTDGIGRTVTLQIPDAGIYIAILCNGYNLPASPRSLAEHIVRLVLNEPATDLTTIPTFTPQDYAGTYRVAANQNLIITSENGKLIGQLGAKRPLIATGIDTFTTPDKEMSFTFLRDAAHHVDRILVRPDGPGPGLYWPRIDPVSE